MDAAYDLDFDALGLSKERFEAFRHSFQQFDKSHTGMITPKQFESLAYELGEEFDVEELEVAIASCVDPKTNLISFQKFLPWWIAE